MKKGWAGVGNDNKEDKQEQVMMMKKRTCYGGQ